MYNKDRMIIENLGLASKDKGKMSGHWGDVPFTVQHGELRLNGSGTLQGSLKSNPDVLMTNIYCVVFTQDVVAPKDSSHLFSDCPQLKSIQGAERLDTSQAEDMSYMFANDPKLNAVDMQSWDTSHVTDMTAMFYKVGLEEIDLRSWDVRNVESMAHMFDHDLHLISLNVSGMNAVHVKDLNHFVYNDLRLLFLSFRGFDTRSAQNMQKMFGKNTQVKSIDLRGLDAAHVANMQGMFQRCYELREIIGIQRLATKHFKHMKDMFECDMKLDTLLTTNNTRLYAHSDNSLAELFLG